MILPIKIDPKEEVFVMMRIAELIQINQESLEKLSDRHLLCAVYLLGRKDEREGK